MTDKELLDELQSRLAVTHADYARLEAKYLACTEKLRHYQLHNYFTREQLEAYVVDAGWEPRALNDTVRHGLSGVVEAYLRFCGLLRGL